MATAIRLRDDFTAEELRRLARSSRDAKQVRRLLSLAVIRDGGSWTEAARTGGAGLQIVRDWVVRFNADGPAGLGPWVLINAVWYYTRVGSAVRIDANGNVELF